MTIATDDRPLLSSPPALDFGREDQLFLLQGSWEQFELIHRGCEENKGLRLSYFDGTIELLMPGLLHEIFSHAIGYLLTCFLAHRGILFFAMGFLKKIPDLAIEKAGVK